MGNHCAIIAPYLRHNYAISPDEQSSFTNGEQETARYNHDVDNNVSEVYEPLGQKTETISDRNGEVIQETLGDGHQLTTQRDDFLRALLALISVIRQSFLYN